MKPQTQQVYRYLCRHGKLTAMDALHKIGCFRLAARIEELRASGIPVRTDLLVKNGRRFAEYRLA